MARAQAGTPLGIGVIGCGTIAFSAHLPAITRLDYRVSWWRSPICARSRRPARRSNSARRTTTPITASCWPDIAIVVICTPEFLHREQVVAAAEAGKHILCEKPMADSLELLM